MSEHEVYPIIAWVELAFAALCLVVLSFVTAPYGRHVRRGWGFMLPSRVGWVVMELPSAVGFVAIYLLGEHRFDAAPLVMLCLWEAHYIHRTFIFPWRLKVSNKDMPAAIVLFGVTFNCVNTYLNARWISALHEIGPEWLVDPRFVIGVLLFVTGYGVNQYADAVLLGLRQHGETGYQIPHGGLYRFVSCPNYLGELMEWLGWAIATWSLGGVAFAVFTLANLLPRARAHHRWYRQTFADYPKERRALIPFVL